MKQKKFLTVFAVFDEETQDKLKNLQNSVLRLGYPGTQTMGIPFHVSLGSFRVECGQELAADIKKVCAQTKEFTTALCGVGSFGDDVLFIEPKNNAELTQLHKAFDGNFADGFPWYPHVTIFCGEKEQASTAREYLRRIFQPFEAKITGLRMGEFFPPRIIAMEELRKE